MTDRRLFAFGLAAASGLWATLLMTAPYLATHDHGGRAGDVVAAGAYVAGRVVCHQQAERSFRVWAAPMPVCARCSGLYAAAPFGALAGLATIRRRPGRRRAGSGDTRRWSVHGLRMILLITVVPTVATVGSEVIGLAQPSNVARMVSALPLGASVAWVVTLVASGRVDEQR